MAAKFTRTIVSTTALAKAIDKKTLEVSEIKIPLPDAYDDCDKALKACQKIVYAENPNVIVLNVVSLEQHNAKYEMDLATFLAHASLVEE